LIIIFVGNDSAYKAKADIERKISQRTPPKRYNGKGHLMGTDMIIKKFPTGGT